MGHQRRRMTTNVKRPPQMTAKGRTGASSHRGVRGSNPVSSGSQSLIMPDTRPSRPGVLCPACSGCGSCAHGKEKVYGSIP